MLPTNVVHLRAAQGNDPVFFTKDQIKVGTRLVYWGRLSPGQIYIVTHITSYRRRRGMWIGKSVQQVEHLHDDVTVHPLGKREAHKLSFGYMSYSAIWRLAQ